MKVGRLPLLLTMLLVGNICLFAQDALITSKPKVDLYGLLKIYLMADSRSGAVVPPGLLMDDFDNDLNSNPSSTMTAGASMIGLNFTGSNVGWFEAMAKLECDFLANTAADVALRIRHAYIMLNRKNSHSSILVGQTWHPLFGDIYPRLLHINDGGCFIPVNRSPMLRYTFHSPKIGFEVAAIYQTSKLASYGPEGRSRDYLARNFFPELYFGASYGFGRFRLGIGISWLSLKPRIKAEADGDEASKSIKVKERVYASTFMIDGKYQATESLMFQFKSTFGSNTGNSTMPGGYWVRSENSFNGRRDYSVPVCSATWISIQYNIKRWQFGAFAGYIMTIKNGHISSDTEYYGTCRNLAGVAEGLLLANYTIGAFSIGAEYLYINARYYNDEISEACVGNHRLTVRAAYAF